MAFTGRPGTSSSMASNVVPMLGAGGTKRAKALVGSMRPTGSISRTHFYVFNEVSITIYRAVARGLKLITVFRTN